MVRQRVLVPSFVGSNPTTPATVHSFVCDSSYSLKSLVRLVVTFSLTHRGDVKILNFVCVYWSEILLGVAILFNSYAQLKSKSHD